MKTVPALERATDAERVAFVEKVIGDVERGRIATTAQVHQALEPLGTHFGAFGCSSSELETAIAKLKVACGKKHI